MAQIRFGNQSINVPGPMIVRIIVGIGLIIGAYLASFPY